MAYTRRNYSRRYVPRKYARKGRNPSSNPIKRYVGKRRNIKYGNMWRDVQMLKGLVNTEIKYRDENFPSVPDGYWNVTAKATVGTPGTSPVDGYVHFVVGYPQIGDDFNQREGRSIKLKSIQIKGRLSLFTSSEDTEQRSGYARVYIIVDHQAQEGEAPDPVPILFQTDVNGDYSTESRVNRQRNKRWSILAVNKVYLSSGSYPVKDINIYKKLNDKIKFDGSTSADFMDKAFHVVVLTPSVFPTSGATSYSPRFNAQFNSRITYIDN